MSAPASVGMQGWEEGDTTAFSASHLPMIVFPDPKMSLEEGDCQVIALAKLSLLYFLTVCVSEVAEGEGCSEKEDNGGGGDSGPAVVAAGDNANVNMEGCEEGKPVPLSDAEGSKQHQSSTSKPKTQTVETHNQG